MKSSTSAHIYQDNVTVAAGYWRCSNSGRWFAATKDGGIPGYGVRFTGYDWHVFDELSEAIDFVSRRLASHFGPYSGAR